jgi:hypothetical protein
MADAVNVFPPGLRITDADGAVVPGGTLTFYLAGTTDALTVYSNRGLTSSLGNVVYLDSAGYPVAAEDSSTKVAVYVGTDPYKVVCKDADAVTLWTHDDMVGAVVGSGGSDSGDFLTEETADFRYTRNASSLTEDATIADTDLLPRWSTADSLNRSITWAAFKTALATAYDADGTILEGGTLALFVQTTAPTGWTKGATHDNKALRVVTGTASSGGSVAFTTAFDTARALSGTVGGTSISEAQMASHDHNMTIRYFLMAATAGSADVLVSPGEVTFTDGNITEVTDVTGSDSSHTHSFSGTVNVGVQYVDVIIAAKD